MEKRKSAAAERIHTFGAVVGARTVKDAAARAREGLRTEGFQRGAAPCLGKENSDPWGGKESRAPGGVENAAKSGRIRTGAQSGGVENVVKNTRVKRTGVLTPRLKRQTRLSSRRPVESTGGSLEKATGKQRKAAERCPTKNDSAESSGEESSSDDETEEDEAEEELTSPRLLTSTCFPGEFPYVHSGAKKVVPIRSVYARGSPENASPAQESPDNVPESASSGQEKAGGSSGNAPESASPGQEKTGRMAESGDREGRPGKAPAVHVDLSGEGGESGVGAVLGGHVADGEAGKEAPPGNETAPRKAHASRGLPATNGATEEGSGKGQDLERTSKPTVRM